jgi:hypothetical protein
MSTWGAAIMPEPELFIRSIEFVDARDPAGRPARLGIGVTEDDTVVVTSPPVVVLAPSQVPRVQRLMREALRDVTLPGRD